MCLTSMVFETEENPILMLYGVTYGHTSETIFVSKFSSVFHHVLIMYLLSTFCGISLDHSEQMKYVFPRKIGQLVRRDGIITAAFGLFNMTI